VNLKANVKVNVNVKGEVKGEVQCGVNWHLARLTELTAVLFVGCKRFTFF
jgi:hypothetical protein